MRRCSQVERQRSAKPLSSVRIRASPPRLKMIPTTIYRLIELLNIASQRLKTAKIATHLFEAELLLQDVLGYSMRITLYLHANDQIPPDKILLYEDLINRRITGEPTAYIIGKSQFMDWEFDLSPVVMIPRRETERLVEEVIRIAKGEEFNSRPLQIIDLCTGSGVIAISLAKVLDCRLYATDISKDALSIAKRNADKLGVSHAITFLEGNLLEPIKSQGLHKKIDIIISNPPYVEDWWLSKNSSFEPQIALSGGRDGIKFYPAIINESERFLRIGGYLFLEIGASQSKKINKLFSANYSVKIIKDYQGKERIIAAQFHPTVLKMKIAK